MISKFDCRLFGKPYIIIFIIKKEETLSSAWEQVTKEMILTVWVKSADKTTVKLLKETIEKTCPNSFHQMWFALGC